MRNRLLAFLLSFSAVFALGAGDINQNSQWPSTVYGSMIVDAFTPFEVTDGLAGLWLGPNTPGSGSTAPDESGLGNDGTLVNMDAADWVTWPGGSGTALDFDGANDYGTVADNDALDLTSAITISVCIYPHTYGYDVSGNKYGRIIRKGTNYDLLLVDTVANDETVFFQGGGGALKANDYSIDLNVKQHLLVTDNGTTAKIYLDGSEIKSGSSVLGSANTDALIIANYNAGTTPRYYNGLLKQIRIYNRALNTAEISVRAADCG